MVAVTDGILNDVLDDMQDRSAANLRTIFRHLRDKTRYMSGHARDEARRAASIDGRGTSPSGG